MWTATRNLAGLPSVPFAVWTAIGIAWVFSAILPLFYFALWRSGGRVPVARRVRRLMPAGAIAGVALLTTEFPIKTWATLLSGLGTLSCVALIAALFFRPGGPAVSRLLQTMTWIAVVGGGFWFGVNLLSLISNPTAGPLRTLLEQVCLFTVPVAVFAGRRQD